MSFALHSLASCGLRMGRLPRALRGVLPSALPSAPGRVQVLQVQVGQCEQGGMADAAMHVIAHRIPRA